MKTIRLACLTITLAIMAATPRLSAESRCCGTFNVACDNACWDGGHGGMYFDDCNVGGSGSDYCWCEDNYLAYGYPTGMCAPD